MNEPGLEARSEGLIRRSRFRARYLWLVGLCVYLAAVWWLGWEALGNVIARVSVAPIVAMMLIELCAEWLRALKWRIALGPGNNAVALFFLSKAVGYWSPGRVGELSPLLLKCHRTPKMGAWIVVDRLLEMGATLGLGLAGLLALQVAQKGLFLALGIVVCATLALCAYLITRQRLFIWMVSHIREGGLFSRIAAFLAETSGEVATQFRSKAPVAALMTVAATAMDLGAAMMLLAAFGYVVTFPTVAVAQCVHTITSTIPVTPNATGIPYVSAAVLLNQVAGIPFPVLAAAVAVHLGAVNIVFWSSFGIGAMDWRGRVR